MEWMCEECGALYDEYEPPCEDCGHARFERPYVRQPDQPADDGTRMQWVCTSCGRSHPKHSPPCSRCGETTLERRAVGVDESELSAPGYRDVLDRWQLAVLALVVLAAAVVGLGFVGVLDLPGASAGSGPTVPEAPGNATSVDGTSLATVEQAYVDGVNRERDVGDASAAQRTDGLDRIAAAYNKGWVRSEYGDGEVPIEEVRSHVGSECSGDAVLARLQILPSVYRGADEPGTAIAEQVLLQRSDVGTVSASRTGVDVHAAPDGRLFLTQVLC